MRHTVTRWPPDVLGAPGKEAGALLRRWSFSNKQQDHPRSAAALSGEVE